MASDSEADDRGPPTGAAQPSMPPPDHAPPSQWAAWPSQSGHGGGDIPDVTMVDRMAPPRLDIMSHRFACTPAGLSLDFQVFEDARRALANLEAQQRQFARHALTTEERQSRTAETHAQQCSEMRWLRPK